ncbi:MAG: Unknown protein [uncultured Sulfurovum sp.]|uniref:Uncharacterized protein n=1 Tax=uncultured Sulfurovum sp. TaxID=269237 RepID=A0A6S6RW72_9BACT|nr:MAG: Unknown protein [uncultured Sulfurovum sp.]
MINIIIQISIYILIAILLGSFFGWLITKIFLRQKYQDKLDTFIATKSVDVDKFNMIKDELFQYKKENKRLRTEHKKAFLGYEGQKHVLDEHNATLDEFQRRLLSKDEVIASLTATLSEVETKVIELEKKYEEEVDAFMFERTEVTKKYKNLLEKHEAYKQHKSMLTTNDSWFSRLFNMSSKRD